MSNLKSTRCAIGILTALCYGTVTISCVRNIPSYQMEPNRESQAVLFAKASRLIDACLEDYSKTSYRFGVVIVGSGMADYVLPESVDEVVKQGRSILPEIERIKDSSGGDRAALASIISRILQARKVERTFLQVDADTGIRMFSYSVSR